MYGYQTSLGSLSSRQHAARNEARLCQAKERRGIERLAVVLFRPSSKLLLTPSYDERIEMRSESFHLKSNKSESSGHLQASADDVYRSGLLSFDTKDDERRTEENSQVKLRRKTKISRRRAQRLEAVEKCDCLCGQRGSKFKSIFVRSSSAREKKQVVMKMKRF